MKAVVCHKYGGPEVLALQEVDKPIPQDDEVQIKIRAVSVNAGDWHLMRGTPFPVRLMFGLTKPKYTILGVDIAGEVEAVGKNVTQFKPGDAVFGDLSTSGYGGFAEYACAKENFLALKPENLSFEEASTLPTPAVAALQGLRDKGKVGAGQTVVVNGASGGVGTYAVQIAKAFGAEVTGVCSAGKMDMVRSIGADHVIDYKQEDFTANGKQYDLVLAVDGYHPISHYKRALSPTGKYVMVGGAGAQFYQAMFLGPLMSKKGGKELGNILIKPNQQDLLFLKGLVEQGKITPVIDRTFSLEEVPEAIAYLEAGRARGKVVVTP